MTRSLIWSSSFSRVSLVEFVHFWAPVRTPAGSNNMSGREIFARNQNYSRSTNFYQLCWWRQQCFVLSIIISFSQSFFSELNIISWLTLKTKQLLYSENADSQDCKLYNMSALPANLKSQPSTLVLKWFPVKIKTLHYQWISTIKPE